MLWLLISPVDLILHSFLWKQCLSDHNIDNITPGKFPLHYRIRSHSLFLKKLRIVFSFFSFVSIVGILTRTKKESEYRMGYRITENWIYVRLLAQYEKRWHFPTWQFVFIVCLTCCHYFSIASICKVCGLKSSKLNCRNSLALPRKIYFENFPWYCSATTTRSSAAKVTLYLPPLNHTLTKIISAVQCSSLKAKPNFNSYNVRSRSKPRTFQCAIQEQIIQRNKGALCSRLESIQTLPLFPQSSFSHTVPSRPAHTFLRLPSVSPFYPCLCGVLKPFFFFSFCYFVPRPCSPASSRSRGDLVLPGKVCEFQICREFEIGCLPQRNGPKSAWVVFREGGEHRKEKGDSVASWQHLSFSIKHPPFLRLTTPSPPPPLSPTYSLFLFFYPFLGFRNRDWKWRPAVFVQRSFSFARSKMASAPFGCRRRRLPQNKLPIRTLGFVFMGGYAGIHFYSRLCRCAGVRFVRTVIRGGEAPRFKFWGSWCFLFFFCSSIRLQSLGLTLFSFLIF